MDRINIHSNTTNKGNLFYLERLLVNNGFDDVYIDASNPANWAGGFRHGLYYNGNFEDIHRVNFRAEEMSYLLNYSNGAGESLMLIEGVWL